MGRRTKHGASFLAQLLYLYYCDQFNNRRTPLKETHNNNNYITDGSQGITIINEKRYGLKVRGLRKHASIP